MNIQLMHNWLHPGKLFSINLWVCIYPIVKIKSKIFPFLAGLDTCCIHHPCRILAAKGGKQLPAVKGDQQIPGALKSPSTTSGPSKLVEWLIALFTCRK